MTNHTKLLKWPTSKRRSMTRLIWAPAGDFLMLLIIWSLSVSLENLTAGAGGRVCVEVDFCTLELVFGGVEVFVEACFAEAILERVDWHFSCCFRNLAKFSCSDIYHKIGIRKTQQYNCQWKYRNRSIREQHITWLVSKKKFALWSSVNFEKFNILTHV